MTVLLLAAVLPWMLIGFGCWFFYQLVRQNGRILLRLEALEQRLEAQDAEPPPSPTAAAPSGLPVGSIAPEFESLDLAGTRHCLSEFRGRSVLLIFFNPDCGFWHTDGIRPGGLSARRWRWAACTVGGHYGGCPGKSSAI